MNRIISNRALNILFEFIKKHGSDSSKIILPSNICHDVIFLLSYLGIEIQYLDIDKNTLELDKKAAIREVDHTKDTILLWNHTYGNEEVPYNFFAELKLKAPQLIIVDDRCLCNPKKYRAEPNDKIIDLIIYSTGYGKQVELDYGAFGLLNTQYKASYEYHDFAKGKYLRLKSLLLNSKFEKLLPLLQDVWMKIDIDPVNEINYMEELDKEEQSWRSHKEQLMEIYYNEIDNNYFLQEKFNNWRLNILVQNKNEFLRIIQREGLFASSHYPSMGSIFTKQKFLTSEWLHGHVINLFFNKHFTKDMVFKMTKLINKYANPI